MEKQDFGVYFTFGLLILFSIGLVTSLEVNSMNTITGMATTSSAQTSAVIANYFSINVSTNLSDGGIAFSILSLPAVNVSAQGNALGSSNNGTEMYLTVERDSNVQVDFCLNSNDSLRSGTNAISLDNYMFSNYTSSNTGYPALNLSYSFLVYNSSTYGLVQSATAIGSSSYFRFWLSVPASQSAGTYKNTIRFKGVQTGNACN